MTEIIWNQVSGPPRVTAVNAKPLIRLMLNQAPADLSPQERALLEEGLTLAEALEVVMMQRDGAGGVRETLSDFIGGWSATHGALAAMSRIPASVSPKGQRAAKLVAIAFPEDLAFTRLPAAQAWAYGDRALLRFRDTGVDHQIDELVGADYLRVARKVTTALGEHIGVGRTTVEIPDPTAVQQLLTKFQRAIGRYSRVMLAKVDEEDPASVERFRKAVVIPIDRYRSTRTVREDEPVDPNEPTDPGSPVIDPNVEPDAPVDPSS